MQTVANIRIKGGSLSQVVKDKPQEGRDERGSKLQMMWEEEERSAHHNWLKINCS